MTIDINYGKHTVFEIEFWEEKYEQAKDENAWYSELDCLLCVEGISYFLRDSIGKNGFNFDEFIEDSKDIQELRGFLWEVNDNKLMPLKYSSERHYHFFYPKLKETIYAYCEKYGFSINID